MKSVNTSTVLEATAAGATALDAAVAQFGALADPTRLRILAVLACGSRCVCDVQTAVDVAPNLLSYHLRVLRDAGLVEASRRGRWIDYRVADIAGTTVAAALDLAKVRAGDVAALSAACATPAEEPRR